VCLSHFCRGAGDVLRKLRALFPWASFVQVHNGTRSAGKKFGAELFVATYPRRS
jgi:hypothetical protein